MELFEKVEKLSKMANVTYEEAKDALEAADEDMLDAMILLENQGKTSTEKRAEYSTKYEDNAELAVVADSESKSDRKDDKMKSDNKLTNLLKKIWKVLSVNYLIIEKDDNRIVKMPLWMFLIILLVGIEIVPIVIVVSMLFGVRYSFTGESDLKAANEAAQKAEDLVDSVAQHVKDEYNKL